MNLMSKHKITLVLFKKKFDYNDYELCALMKHRSELSEDEFSQGVLGLVKRACEFYEGSDSFYDNVEEGALDDLCIEIYDIQGKDTHSKGNYSPEVFLEDVGLDEESYSFFGDGIPAEILYDSISVYRGKNLPKIEDGGVMVDSVVHYKILDMQLVQTFDLDEIFSVNNIMERIEKKVAKVQGSLLEKHLVGVVKRSYKVKHKIVKNQVKKLYK